MVSLANRVIAAARGRVAGSKLHLIGQRDPGPAPSFHEHPDEVAEAAAVARSIKQLVEAGTPPAEIAVLYRINAQSEVYEEALTEAGIPFQVRGGRVLQPPGDPARRCWRCSAPPSAGLKASCRRSSARCSSRWV